MSNEGFSLKDQLFNADKVNMLAGWMAGSNTSFRVEEFTSQVMERLPALELKARADWIADCLIVQLPRDFPAAADQIRAALPPPLDPTRNDDDFGDFILAPFGVVVERMGLDAHPSLSLDLFEELTQRFSVELSIRSFLNRWPEEVLARMEDWVGHPNYHVRRLVSEGTRPKLPWAQKIAVDPMRPLLFLDRLHGDPTRYVTRSVANHLNDVAKIDPQAVIDRLARWKSAARQDPKELAWMTRHALRTLIKQGHGGAMELLGYRPDARVALERLELSPKSIAINSSMEIALSLRAEREERVIVDYAIDFVKSGNRRGRKVFKMKDCLLKAGTTTTIRKLHRFKGGATTFTLFPGPHEVHVQVNGKVVGSAAFDLTDG